MCCISFINLQHFSPIHLSILYPPKYILQVSRVNDKTSIAGFTIKFTDPKISFHASIALNFQEINPVSKVYNISDKASDFK